MAYLSKKKLERLVELICEFKKFRLCGPSDDIDVQTSTIYSFKHIVKGIKYYCRYLDNENLSKEIGNIETGFDTLHEVYEVNTELAHLIDDLDDCIQDMQIKFINEGSKIKEYMSLKPIDRFSYIEEVASYLQQQMTTSDINVFLSSFNIDFKKEKMAESKKVYVKNILSNVKDNVLLAISNELSITRDSHLMNIEHLNRVDFDFINDQINKCNLKIQSNDYEGAITNARSLMESICIYILNEENKDIKSEGNLLKLYKQVSNLLGMDAGKYSQNSLKQICSGFFSILNGLSNLRNELSDAHGKDKPTYYKPSYRHAVLAVNSSKTISEFLLSSWQDNKS